jgi:hydroxyethylthiazole kinase-like uncharacterized protein yjeF
VIPVLTTAEMAGVDAAAPEPVEVLVGRAGAATAARAVALLGRAYGARVAVVAGRGNNGADGRAAAAILARRGAKVALVDPAADAVTGADLVVDAAYGTGLHRPYRPPAVPPGVPVLAVDIPSGVSGDDGVVPEGGGALAATETVTFAALKPGLLLGAGRGLAGAVRVAGIGLAQRAGAVASAWLVEDRDLGLLPERAADGHKWRTAVGVVAGSPGMTGAPWLVARAALRAGAGYVRLGIPGVRPGDTGLPPGEAVGVDLGDDWVTGAARALQRCRAAVVGPGLGGSTTTGAGSDVARLLASAEVPVVVDADGLNALGSFDAVPRRLAPVVLTPHEGEWARLAGSPPPADRIGAVRDAARRSGAVVLLKGPVTVVAAPDGRVWLAGAGSPALATAGTGDVLSGIIGAFLARGMDAGVAAALGAHVHGRAATSGRTEGLVAGDLPELVSAWLSPFARAAAAVDVKVLTGR